MRLAEQDWEAGQVARLHETLDAHLPEPGKSDFRGWEWYYFLSQCHQDLLTLYGHTGPVHGVTWSPDGARVASCSQDGTVKIWNAITGEEVFSMGHGTNTYVFSVAWSPDGGRLVSGGRWGSIRVWDSATGKQVLSCRHGSGGVTVAWSCNGEHFASTTWKHGIKIWDGATGREFRTLTIPNSKGSGGLSWSPKIAHLLACTLSNPTIHRGRATIFDVENGREVRAFHWGRTAGARVEWSPDGRLLAVANRADKAKDQVMIWDAETGKRVSDLGFLTDVGRSLAWSPDSARVACGRGDSTVRIFDVASGQEVQRIRGHVASVNSLAWSSDGKHIASASADIARTARRWLGALPKPMMPMRATGWLGPAPWPLRPSQISPVPLPWPTRWSKAIPSRVAISTRSEPSCIAPGNWRKPSSG